MKKYFVLLEDVKRSNREIGYCDPMIEAEFDDEESARKFYETINEQAAFNHLCEEDKKDHYIEKSLMVAEYKYDKDFDKWIDSGELHEFIETKSAGVNYLQKD